MPMNTNQEKTASSPPDGGAVEAEMPKTSLGGKKRPSPKTVSFLVVAILAILLFLIVNIQAATDFFRAVGRHIAPLVVGVVIAYLCDPILRFYEYTLFRRMKKNGVRRGISLFLTLVTVLGTLALILMMILPQLADSIRNLVANYDEYLDRLLRNVQTLVDGFTEDMPIEINISSKERVVALINDVFGSVEAFYQEFVSPIIGTDSPGQTVLGALGGTFTFLKNLVLGFFIAVYILTSKEKRVGQTRKFRRAMFKPETDAKLTSLVSLVDRSFGGFICGKLIDSIIIGILTFGLMTVLEVSPYNLLIATFVGMTNIIPVFGPFIGAIPSFLIVLISNPSKAFLFLILILVIQQLDGNVIGPKILGDNVGVSSLTVLVAITLCGSLWGIAGMIIGVPLFAVVIEVVRRTLEARLAARGEPTDTAAYYPERTLANAERDLYYEHAGMRYRYEHSRLKPRVDRVLKRLSRSRKNPIDTPDADAESHETDRATQQDSKKEE